MTADDTERKSPLNLNLIRSRTVYRALSTLLSLWLTLMIARSYKLSLYGCALYGRARGALIPRLHANGQGSCETPPKAHGLMQTVPVVLAVGLLQIAEGFWREARRDAEVLAIEVPS